MLQVGATGIEEDSSSSAVPILSPTNGSLTPTIHEAH
jgi:hypothetical protein